MLLLVLYLSKHPLVVFQSTAWEVFTKLSTVCGWGGVLVGGVGAGSDQLSTETKAP